jgi:serine/threonine protein kinase
MLAMLEQAAKGLYFLHRNGVVHCDFKPANIILCRRFLVRLIDFGEAHSLAAGKRGNPGRTFPFAAPEVYARGEITPALDAYALGVTIYRCLFGDYMWGGLLRKHKRREEEVVPWILPERFREAGERRVALALACLSLKCTALAPEGRPALPWVITVLQECRSYLGQLHYR